MAGVPAGFQNRAGPAPPDLNGRSPPKDPTPPMFDTLIKETCDRFALRGDQARQLLGTLVALIFDDKRGGFAGFARLLQDKGMGELLQSWLRPGPHAALGAPQVEATLGQPMVAALARRIGASQATTAGAIGQLLPGIVGQLSTDGQAPAGLPATLKGWIGEAGSTLGDLAHTGWGAAAAGAAALAGGARKAGGGLAGLLRGLLIVAALAIAVLLLLRACKAERPGPAAAAPEVASAVEGDASVEPRFSLQTANGRAEATGQVASPEERQRLLEALQQTYGADNVEVEISLDTRTAPAGWIDRLVALLPQLKADGLKLALNGDRLQIDTSALPEDLRFSLSAKLRDSFAGLKIDGLWDQALAALGALKPGFSADDLVRALNLSSIRFDTGSATISRDSDGILATVAEAITAAPAGTRIEVGGHTDNTGDAATNLALSQQRAEAVAARLAQLGVAPERLVAKGYGQAEPVADNATEEGRAANRRMAFTLLK